MHFHSKIHPSQLLHSVSPSNILYSKIHPSQPSTTSSEAPPSLCFSLCSVLLLPFLSPPSVLPLGAYGAARVGGKHRRSRSSWRRRPRPTRQPRHLAAGALRRQARSLSLSAPLSLSLALSLRQFVTAGRRAGAGEILAGPAAPMGRPVFATSFFCCVIIHDAA